MRDSDSEDWKPLKLSRHKTFSPVFSIGGVSLVSLSSMDDPDDKGVLGKLSDLCSFYASSFCFHVPWPAEMFCRFSVVADRGGSVRRLRRHDQETSGSGGQTGHTHVFWWGVAQLRTGLCRSPNASFNHVNAESAFSCFSCSHIRRFSWFWSWPLWLLLFVTFVVFEIFGYL